jgi:hypothetical protein
MGRYLDMLGCDQSDISDQSHAQVDIEAEPRSVVGVRSLLSLLSHSRLVDARRVVVGPETPAVAALSTPRAFVRRRLKAEQSSPAATVIAPVQWFEGVAADEPPYDQPYPARRGVIRHPSGRFEHFCAVCGAWGSFGFGVTPHRPGRWFCFDHRELGNEPAAEAP